MIVLSLDPPPLKAAVAILAAELVGFLAIFMRYRRTHPKESR